MQVQRLRVALGGRADQVAGLENRKVQLQVGLQERRAEVGVQLDSL